MTDRDNEQLSMWSKQPIVHVALAMKGAKFDPTDQPVKVPGDYEPGQRVRFIVEGYVDDKVSEDKTEAGWCQFVSVTIDRAYEVDAATAERLVTEGREAVGEALRKKLGRPLEAVAS